MQPKFKQHSEQINNQASDWFALMQSGSISQSQQQQFEQWQEASEEHRDAYLQLEVIWADLTVLASAPEGIPLQQSRRTGLTQTGLIIKKGLRQFFSIPKLIFRPTLAITLSALVVLLTGLYFSEPNNIEPKFYQTQLAEVKTITLDDGSTITLGAKSRIKTWASDTERHVSLESGQAFFMVSKDPLRPFWVDSGDLRVRVVGTQFDVRNSSDRVRVAVLEGVVSVSDSKASSSASRQAQNIKSPGVVLTAGQQIIKSFDQKLPDIRDISEFELTAWHQGRLIYSNAKLVDVISDANRYYNGTISLPSDELKNMEVTLALRTDQIKNLPEMLTEMLPVELNNTSDDNIVITPRQQ